MDTQQAAAQAVPDGHPVQTEEAKPRPRSTGRWLAWGLWGVSILLLGVALILPIVTNPTVFMDDLLVNIFGLPALLAYATVGALISSRHPENPIGWLFSVTAFFVALGVAAEEYARFTLFASPGSLPGGLGAAWLSGWLRNTGFLMMFTFLLLLFPDGHLPSPRWRIPAWLVGFGVVLATILDAFDQGTVTDTLQVENPLGSELMSAIGLAIGDLLILSIVMVCMASVIVRFRHSTGDERLQLKWFAYAAVLAIAQFAIRTAMGIFIQGDLVEPIGEGMLLFTVATFPIAAGIAILKYRLYDIDLLVNRTLVYVPLTAILAGVYAASLGLLQKLFLSFTGEQSDAAIVITTLILVATSTPIKNSLQSAVDKRFKEAPDPTKKLHSFCDQVVSFVQMNNGDQLRQRLLDEAISAFDAAGGVIFSGQAPHLQVALASEGWNGDARVSVAPTDPTPQLALISLGPRSAHLEYTAKDRETLLEIVDAVAQALALDDARIRNHALAPGEPAPAPTSA